MNLYRMYETDTDLERGGIRVDIAPDVYITVARAGGGNTAFAKTHNEVMKPFRAALDELPDEKIHELQARIYAKSVIRDWAGITDRDGNVLEFTEDNVVKILVDLPDLFSMLRVIAADANGYRPAEAAGNSPTG